MRVICGLMAVLLALYGSLAVDSNNFKTCDQSGFCKRLRDYKPDHSHYVLNLDTVIVHANVLTAEVLHVSTETDKKTVLWHYALKLSALVDGTFRVEMDETDPLYPRYRTQLALDGEPKPDGLKLVSNKDGRLTVTNTQGHNVVITAEPLKLEFQDAAGAPAVVLNGRGLLHVEPLRPAQVAEGDVVEAESRGESFRGHHDSRPRGDEAVSLDVTFPDAEVLYGLPEHTDGLALRSTASGEPYRLYNLDVFEYELDSRAAIYGAVPVLHAHGPKRSASVFWHNSAETWVDVAADAAGAVAALAALVTGRDRAAGARFMSESGVLDVFVLLGPTPAAAVAQYARLTGVMPLPPRFSLAYHQCRWNYVDEADVRALDAAFDAHDVPADVYWLDIEYTDRKKYFTWDADKFPHPAEMVANVTAKGRKMVVIIDPHIKREAGYFLHEDATDNGLYVKDKDGKDYEGWCWPGASSYLDFFNPAASRYYAERFSFENFPGTSNDVHIWNDMNEPSVFNGPEVTMPKDCRHYKPPQAGADGLAAFWEHRHVHNEYGLWHVRATHDGMIARANGRRRPFILTRAVFAGTQRYAAVWTGDNAATWEFLAASVPMCLSLGAGGVPLCGADVGGFFKYPEAQLMTRWYQAGAFQPFFRAHSHIETPRREPWLYPPAAAALLRDAVARRYALLGLWYTLFYEHSLDGLPVMRPLLLQYPADSTTFTMDDQYLLGDKLLVRPVVQPDVTSVRVYLPGGPDARWYDVDSYRQHSGGGYIDQEVTISKIPVYQRGGTVIPRKERIRRSSALMADDPYTLVVALDANGTAAGTLYIDDGETYDYKEGKYIYARFEYTAEALTYRFIDASASYPTRAWLERVVIAGVKTAPRAARLAQGSGGSGAGLQMTHHRGNDVLVVRKPGASMAKEWSIAFQY